MRERLNARIDAELARKIEVLRRRLGASTTDVVRRSIEHLYRSEVEGGPSAAAIVEQSGLIGCADGPADLSTHYKRDLARTLRSKT